MLYAYVLPLKFSSKCIDPNYFFYWFECFHMICPNLSSAPCISLIKSLHGDFQQMGSLARLECSDQKELTSFEQISKLAMMFLKWKFCGGRKSGKTPGRNLPTRKVVVLRNSLVATNQCNSNLLLCHTIFLGSVKKFVHLKKHVDAKRPEAIIRMP